MRAASRFWGHSLDLHGKERQKIKGLLLSTYLFILFSPSAYLFGTPRYSFRATHIPPLPQPSLLLSRLQIHMWDDISVAWKRLPTVPRSTNLLFPHTEVRNFPLYKQRVKARFLCCWCVAGWHSCFWLEGPTKTSKVNINVWKHNWFLHGTKATSKSNCTAGSSANRQRLQCCVQPTGTKTWPAFVLQQLTTIKIWPYSQVLINSNTTGLKASQVSFTKHLRGKKK